MFMITETLIENVDGDIARERKVSDYRAQLVCVES